jgi:AcrR family transcriptional regulator
MARPAAEPARAPRWQRLGADERRTQILDCARQAFAERPYAQVSMAEIATCAGVQRGLLHHYFGGKHELYVAVVRDLLARFGQLIDGTGRAGPDPGAGPFRPSASPSGGAAVADPAFEELVSTYVDRWLDLVEQQGESWFTLVDAESGTRDPEVLSLIQRARSAMVDGIASALGLGEVTPGLRVVLRSYAGLAETATRDWLRRGSLDRAQAQALLATTLVAMLRDVAPAVEAAAVSPRDARRRPSRARAARA